MLSLLLLALQFVHEVWPWVVAVAGAITIISGILEFLKGGEQPWVDAARGVGRMLYWATIPVHAPWSLMAAKVRDEKKLDDLIGRSEKRDVELDKITKALYNGGTNGLVHQMGIALARTTETLEVAQVPMFECDGKGNNVNANHAYRMLVGATKMQELEQQRWRAMIHGELAEGYYRQFMACAESKCDFIGECDFRNPWSGQPVGRWRVHARATVLADGSLYYVGRFLCALDDRAKEIAQANAWTMVH